MIVDLTKLSKPRAASKTGTCTVGVTFSVDFVERHCTLIKIGTSVSRLYLTRKTLVDRFGNSVCSVVLLEDVVVLFLVAHRAASVYVPLHRL